MTSIKKYIPALTSLTIYTWIKYSMVWALLLMLQSTSLAQLSILDIKELIRTRNSKIIESIQIQKEQQCLPMDQVEIIPYMYHYVRPIHRDPDYSVVSWNSITPDMAYNHFSRLSELQNSTDTKTIFTSELQKYQETNCFPHARMLVLIFDDGRRDNYHFLMPLAQQFDIKVNLWIIVNRISREERIDSFMTWNEIQEMIHSGHFEIVSHSRSHTDLRKKNRNAQYKEICESKTRLEETFGVSINTFVYPMWLYNGTSTQVATHCGYAYAFTTHTRHTNIQAEIHAYPMELSRVRTTKRQDWYTTFPFID